MRCIIHGPVGGQRRIGFRNYKVGVAIDVPQSVIDTCRLAKIGFTLLDAPGEPVTAEEALERKSAFPSINK